MRVKVGDFLYKYMSPAKVGRVLEIHDSGNYDPPHESEPRPPDVTIKFLGGMIERRSSIGLRDFRTLIDDHKRKLRTHELTLKRLEAME